MREPSSLPQNIDSGRLLQAMQSALAILHPGEKLTIRWYDQQTPRADVQAVEHDPQ